MLEREAVFFITHGVGVKTQDLILGLGGCAAVPGDYPSWADSRPRR